MATAASIPSEVREAGLFLDGLRCAGCVNRVERDLRGAPDDRGAGPRGCQLSLGAPGDGPGPAWPCGWKRRRAQPAATRAVRGARSAPLPFWRFQKIRLFRICRGRHNILWSFGGSPHQPSRSAAPPGPSHGPAERVRSLSHGDTKSTKESRSFRFVRGKTGAVIDAPCLRASVPP